MANKRNKQKLTSKQATCVSWLITLILAILTIIRRISIKNPKDDLVYLLLFTLLASLYVFIMLYIVIFKVPDKKRDERRKEIELINIQHLSSTKFTQVYFDPEDTGCSIDIMMTILKEEGCIFYAKLIEYNWIHLIVKDKHNEEVFNVEIPDHLFFYNNFEIQEWP